MEKIEHFGLDFDTFARLIDEMHDEIIIYDNNYRMLYVNKACERHYGFTQEEMVGRCRVFLDTELGVRNDLQEVFDDEGRSKGPRSLLPGGGRA
ncbi:MAG: PAS domain S-box protein [Proteobacteria bacterium]|nr:PAS domain S-box protein [Pseudomonadota bacterium]